MKRFVGVSMSSGKPYSSFLNKNEGQRNFTPILIGLEADREEMYERINKRVDIMMLNGLLKEVKDLYTNKDLDNSWLSTNSFIISEEKPEKTELIYEVMK